MKRKFFYIRGLFRRWYRKRFRKGKSMVEDGLRVFQEFADIYGDSINDIETAEKFFKEFQEETGGTVIVDFLDTDNWDCIRKIEVDKQNGLIWFYWQILEDDPIVNMMRKMAFQLDYYGLCLKFDNVRFIRGKKRKCYGICVNGFTIKEKNVKGFATVGGWTVKGIDNKSSFFATEVVRVNGKTSQYWRFVNTPISSFWILPKGLNIRPQDSEKYLYQIGTKRCETKTKEAFNGLKRIGKLSADRQRTLLKSVGNEMRNAAENLFKLIMCFHMDECHFTVKNYNDILLGDLTGSLKKTIYTGELEKKYLEEITRIANDLSHDSGNPVNLKDIGLLYIELNYFITEFRKEIYYKRREIVLPQTSGKPSPKNYVKEHLHEFCFANEIEETVKQTEGKISYTVEAQLGTFVDLFGDKGKNLLSEDGYFRNTKEKSGAGVLKVWNRDEVIQLTDKIYEAVKQICDDNGFDTEDYSLGLSLDAELRKEAPPSHLFTEEEIKQLMLAGNDDANNKLVIDEEGVAHIIQDHNKGNLYPVSQETWCAGRRYVGKDSTLSDLYDSYVLCMHLWLSYLNTGVRQYDDLYVPDNDMAEVIAKVKEFYK